MKIYSVRWTFLLVIILLYVFPTIAQQSKALDDEKIKQIESIISEEMTKQKIPGLSIAIVANRQLILSKGYGVSSIKSQTSVKPTTIFRLASVSKPITATAVMQLVERGKLILMRPFRNIALNFPKRNGE